MEHCIVTTGLLNSNWTVISFKPNSNFDNNGKSNALDTLWSISLFSIVDIPHDTNIDANLKNNTTRLLS